MTWTEYKLLREMEQPLNPRQKLQVAHALAMGTLPDFIARMSKSTVHSDEEKKAAIDFAALIEPMFPNPRDGFVPKRVMKLINGR